MAIYLHLKLNCCMHNTLKVESLLLRCFDTAISLLSPYFKDVYLYLAQNMLTSCKAAKGRTEILDERN